MTTTNGNQNKILESWTVVKIGPLKVKKGVPMDKIWYEAEEPVRETVERLVQSCKKGIKWSDPSFGPSESDPNGAFAFYNTGKQPDNRYPNPKDCNWVRPRYTASVRQLDEELKAEDSENEAPESGEESDYPEDYDGENNFSDEVHMFCNHGELFSGGVNANDVLQGRLGDCWILSAMSVLATRGDLMEKCFWGCKNTALEKKMRKYGFRVIRLFKDSDWYFVFIDDRLPVFSKSGKPVFASSRDKNELWVSFLEKAYAKLHKAYDSLIGGYVDGGLRDLTGLACQELVLRPGHVGYHPQNKVDMENGALWALLNEYANEWGCMMGCSIQPDPQQCGQGCVESKVGDTGLLSRHAYALVDVGIVNGTQLVRLRNPWGFGEWTGAWSDKSVEFKTNEEALGREFSGPVCKRRDVVSTSQEVTSDERDGTFFMSYDDWKKYFTVLFAAVDFPDAWSGQRVSGTWRKSTAGGNNSLKTWVMNPRHRFFVPQDGTRVYISLCQSDPRLTDGNQQAKSQVPIGFHILEDNGEDLGLPPKKVPGSNIDQAVYNLHVSVDLDIPSMKSGRYVIVPSIYYADRYDEYFLHIYTDRPIAVENGELIAEEANIDDADVLRYTNEATNKIPKAKREELRQFDEYRFRLESSLRKRKLTYRHLVKALQKQDKSKKSFSWNDWSVALKSIGIQPDRKAFDIFSGEDGTLDMQELEILVAFESDEMNLVSAGLRVTRDTKGGGDESLPTVQVTPSQDNSLLVNAVRELQSENDLLHSTIDEMKRENAKMMHLLLLYGKMLKCYDGPVHTPETLFKPVDRKPRVYDMHMEILPGKDGVLNSTRESLVSSRTDPEATAKPENVFDSLTVDNMGDEFMAIKPWIGTIKALTPKVEPDIPTLDKELQLEYIFGYNSTRNSLRTNEDGNPVFYSAAVGVVLDTASNTQHFFRGHTDDIKCIDSYGSKIVTGQEGKRSFACIWDSNSGEELVRLDKFKHQRGVIHVAFSKDGTEVMTVGGDDNHTVAVYDASTGALKSNQKGDKGNIYFATHNGKTFVTGGSKHVSFWESKKKKALFGKTGGGGSWEYLCADAHPNGIVAVGSDKGVICVFEGSKCQSSTDQGVHGAKAVQSICYDAKSNKFYSGGISGSVVTWSLDEKTFTMQRLGSIDCGGIPIKAIQSQFIGFADGCITTNSEKREVLMNAHFRGELWACAANPTNAAVVATAGDDNVLKIWSVSERRQIKELKLPGPSRAIAWSHNGSMIAVALPENSIALYDAHSLREIASKSKIGIKGSSRRARNPPSFTCIQFSPDDSLVACGSNSAQVIVVQTDDCKPKMILNGSSSTVTHLDFSSDGQYVRTNDASYEILFYSLQTKKQVTQASKFRNTEWDSATCPLSYETQGIWPPEADGTDINAVARHGDLMATADDFGKVTLCSYPYPSRTGDDLQEYLGHASHVTNVTFLAEDYVVSIGGRDKAIMCWKLV